MLWEIFVKEQSAEQVKPFELQIVCKRPCESYDEGNAIIIIFMYKFLPNRESQAYSSIFYDIIHDY